MWCDVRVAQPALDGRVQQAALWLIDAADNDRNVVQCCRDRRQDVHVEYPATNAMTDCRRRRVRSPRLGASDDDAVRKIGCQRRSDAASDDAVTARDENRLSAHCLS